MASYTVARPLRTLAAELTRLAPRRTLPDWFVGDPAHKAGISDHNIDDTPGWRTEQTDADTIPEVRAVDIRLPFNAPFTPEQFVQFLVREARAGRMPWLRYVIYKRRIWTRSGGWVTQVYNGSNPHDKHVHVSSMASHDASAVAVNLSPLVGGGTSSPEDWMFAKFGDKGDAVRYLQYRLHNLGFKPGAIDGAYGDGTAKALAAAVKSYNNTAIDGKTFGPAQMIYLDVMWIRKYGPAGQEGPKGDPGPEGPAGPPGPTPQIDYQQLALELLSQVRDGA